MFQAVYAPMHVLRIADQKTPAMEKLFYFVLQTDLMIPKWIKDAEYHSNKLFPPGVKNILEDTKDAASVAVESDDEDDDHYEEELSYVCSYY